MGTVQLSPLDWTVTVVNRRAGEEKGQIVEVVVYDLDSKVLWRRSAPVSAPGAAYGDVLTLPRIESLTPVCFVDLKLRDASGAAVSQNFYWLSRPKSEANTGNWSSCRRLGSTPGMT